MSESGKPDRPGAPGNRRAGDEPSEGCLAGKSVVADPDDHLRGPRPEEPNTGRRNTGPRRAGADPVKTLMHRHRELCERAVDPLEIAAGLEAHGVTDRTAARFRHRDVFSLAEEMFARVPRADDTSPPPSAAETTRPRATWALLTLLPGALCTATVTALRLTDGETGLIAAAAGVLATAVGLRAALRRGPLSSSRDTHKGLGTTTWTWWLLGYAALGDGLLRAAVEGGPDSLPTGGPDGPWPLATAPLLALALAVAPAAWSAHLFAVHARRKLTASRGLEEFAASVRPLLLGTFALFLCALAALLVLCAAALDEPAHYTQACTLGVLLLLARLLTVHGFTHAPAVVLAATALAEGSAPALAFAARLPGCAALAVPVEALVETWGPSGIPVLVCGTGALVLLVHATRTLTRASAHARPDGSP